MKLVQDSTSLCTRPCAPSHIQRKLIFLENYCFPVHCYVQPSLKLPYAYCQSSFRDRCKIVPPAYRRVCPTWLQTSTICKSRIREKSVYEVQKHKRIFLFSYFGKNNSCFQNWCLQDKSSNSPLGVGYYLTYYICSALQQLPNLSLWGGCTHLRNGKSASVSA